MDPLTHITAGAIGGQALRKPYKKDRALLVFCILAAWLPDIDNFIGFWGTELYLIYHRGFTHSFIGGIVVAAVFTWIFNAFVKLFSFRRGFLIAYLFIALHIFLDLITSYGTQIFAPLTNARYAMTSVFIIDPIYTLVMIAILCFSFKSLLAFSFESLKVRKKIAIAGLLWIFLYPATNLGIRYTLEYHTEKRLKREGIEFVRLDVSTDILSPFCWKVIVDQGDTYHIAGIRLLKPNAPLEFISYRKADPMLFQKLGKSAPVFRTYAWFFDFPIVKSETSENGEETLMTIWDLRFASTLAFIRRAMQENGEQPFALRAVLNEENRLIRYYDHRGAEIVITRLKN